MKKSKHPHYDDPSAFRKQFPRIEKNNGVATGRSIILGVEEESYKMGPIRATLSKPSGKLSGYFLSVRGRDKYPDWDSIVWLRYNLIPDAARMVLVLPNLNSYINQEQTDYKFVFTMEQSGWVLDPEPKCEQCNQTLQIASMAGVMGTFKCPEHDTLVEIDMSTWNEAHANGFFGKETKS